jgi:hypothetical protein
MAYCQTFGNRRWAKEGEFLTSMGKQQNAAALS